MNSLKTLLTILILIGVFQLNFGQKAEDTQPPENWLSEYNIYSPQFIRFNYEKYSKEDILKFREKLDLMKSSNYEDKWEGSYGTDYPDEVGVSELRLNFKVGFITYYVYSCLPELRFIDYGKIINTPAFIQLIPEFAVNSPRKSTNMRYVKVKWGDRNYLVEESSLPAFAEKAVGVYVEPEEPSEGNHQKWSNYWVSGDLEKPLVGLPEFPVEYRKFQRLPINAKITLVGKRTIGEKYSEHEYYAESAWYTVAIDAGADKGIKKGMKFEIPKIGSELFITEVKSKTSVGLIRRDINDNKQDLCHNDNFDEIQCPAIKAPLKIKTPVGKFWW